METTNFLEIKKTKSDFPQEKIKSSQQAADFIRQFYSDDIGIFESFFLLILNRACNTIAYAKISQGGTAGTVVDTKIVCKYAIDSLGSAVILAHNHPSGTLTPSEQDIRVTDTLKKALAIFDIQVMDHVILTEESYYSFADNGII